MLVKFTLGTIAWYDRGRRRPHDGIAGSHAGVNFINILRAAFALLFFYQKNFKAKLSLEKSFKKTLLYKKAHLKCL